MGVLWTSDEATAATGGKATRDWQATGVSIDSRTLEPGDLFVALKDARDGHDFVAAALARGAAAALVTHRPEGVTQDAPLLIVPDVLAALTALGAAARARTRAKVIGVTGSVGKTSTKEMLRTILARQGRVHAAEASYNNHWGVPLTLARMPAEADFAVIEIGMNAPGEIAPLARLARPHAALVTTVAAVHQAAFADVDGIAREKSAICEGLVPGGHAILPEGLPVTPILLAAAKAADAKITTFGDRADWRIDSAETTGITTVVRARHGDLALLYKLHSPGRHFAANALGALATVTALGADPAVAACDIAGWTPPPGRGTRETVALDIVDDHLTFDLIDDAYNANPLSMGAALDVLAASAPGRGGRRIAILGDMLELGAGEHDLHAALARHPAIGALDTIHCVGPLMAALWQALPEAKRGRRAESAPELARAAHHLVRAGDIVLVKGSKSSRVSLVVDALRKLGQGQPTETRGPD